MIVRAATPALRASAAQTKFGLSAGQKKNPFARGDFSFDLRMISTGRPIFVFA